MKLKARAEILKDTVEMMFSTDYKERFIAEYTQLYIRWEKLSDYLYGDGWKDFPPEHELNLHQEQANAMIKLMCIMKRRAKSENIELPSFGIRGPVGHAGQKGIVDKTDE